MRDSSRPQEELIFGHAHSDAPKVAILASWTDDPPSPKKKKNQGWSRAEAKTRHFPIRAIGLRLPRDKHELISSSSSCTLEIEYALMCTESQLAPKRGGVCFVVTCKDVKISSISTKHIPVLNLLIFRQLVELYSRQFILLSQFPCS